MALRDNATTSGSAAAMPTHACPRPQPLFTVPVAGLPTFSCPGPTWPSGDVYRPPSEGCFKCRGHNPWDCNGSALHWSTVIDVLNHQICEMVIHVLLINTLTSKSQQWV